MITGGNGQLGKELSRQLKESHSVISLSRKELDIAENEKVEKIISEIKPDLIIHSAAFTAVDQCETERMKAFEVNSLGTGYLVMSAGRVGAKIIYISTDFVFDGQRHSPYPEEEKPNPQSIYGLSKWLGEQFVLQSRNGTIIRTSWLYGHDGKNFVKTMLDLAKMNKEIKVVNDQIGSPTYVNDLVETILHLINKKTGIYHVSNSGECSWFSFARTIFKEAGANPNLVNPITTEEYGALAPRPRYSVLEHHALMREDVKPPRHWKDALQEYIRKESYK
ncbi:dTDP-4-dehydrorhamnose reductase [Bacillus sp. EB600]|uniref:dTDP-4-dehydrorhamnose reductase n=1 Tax=Bacillus sp. EB600 TaxID=2806345 RepID=UPI002108D213|nr:dTDP-4-dehydrorhamnose reductase [Bacillus sp. EB600]